jgi:hypothetical protein
MFIQIGIIVVEDEIDDLPLMVSTNVVIIVVGAVMVLSSGNWSS